MVYIWKASSSDYNERQILQNIVIEIPSEYKVLLILRRGCTSIFIDLIINKAFK
jgi:hypothetical protein